MHMKLMSILKAGIEQHEEEEGSSESNGSSDEVIYLPISSDSSFESDSEGNLFRLRVFVYFGW